MKKVKIVNVKEFEGKWLVYRRSSRTLAWMKGPKDSKAYLTVGMVLGGEVAGQPVDVWCRKIMEQKKVSKEA